MKPICTADPIVVGMREGAIVLSCRVFKKWTHCFQENACLCTSPAMAGHSDENSPCQFYWRDQDRKWPAASTNQTKFSKSRRHGQDIDHGGLWWTLNREIARIRWNPPRSCSSLSAPPPPPPIISFSRCGGLSGRSCPWDVGKWGDPMSYWLVHVDHPVAARKVSWLNPTGLGLISWGLGWFWWVWLGIGLDSVGFGNRFSVG